MRLTATVFFLALCLLAEPAFASGGGGHGFVLKEHGFYIVNFIIFVGILVLFARKPLQAQLGERADTFAQRLERARADFEATQSRLAEARNKVELADVEAAALLARVEQEADRLKATIQERTVLEEKKLRAGAMAALENEKRRLDRRFQAELALTALTQAEATLKQDWQGLPHQDYVAEFADALARGPVSDGGA
jgi:F0F1-type ATP synthase membrane subunit b/b'